MLLYLFFFSIFFFNDSATTEIYTLSLHYALPISLLGNVTMECFFLTVTVACLIGIPLIPFGNYLECKPRRSEEHTSELQSQSNLVCRLLLEKKKKNKQTIRIEEHKKMTTISEKTI